MGRLHYLDLRRAMNIMNEKIIEAMFPGTLEKLRDRICPICNNKIGVFRNPSSYNEYKISGMCQACQDKTFGTD